MTEEDLIEFISKNDANTVLQHMVDMPWSDRRKHAKAVSKLFKATIWVYSSDPDRPQVKDEDAVVVALMATATLSELKAIRLWQLPKSPRIDEVLRTLRPDWIEAWVNFVIEDNPHIISRIAPVWESGLCPRPSSDALILGYYARGSVHSSGEIDEKALLSEDVWRFFEVEGGGEFSLAACDKYASSTSTWEYRLLRYAEAGKLDRDRLLDASLDALDRDFGQFVAGWYSRFHKALKPTPEEIAERTPRYLKLLSSTVPPTVSFAIQALQTADKAQAISPNALLDAIEPALVARAKGTVTSALRLVASAAKRDPALSIKAAQVTALALVSEDAGVQSKALDLVEKLGGAQDAEVREAVAEYVPLAAPSVRARMAKLSGVDDDERHEFEPAGQPAKATAIAPVANADEALALFLKVLENHRDPFEVERAIDGVARFGASLRSIGDKLSPLKKRARQLFDRPNDCTLRFALSITVRDLVEGTEHQTFWQELCETGLQTVLSPGSFGRLFTDRNAEILANVFAGHALPMLSMPSDTSGCITPDDLVERMLAYRESGVEPGAIDLPIALLRLGKAGSPNVLSKLAGETEFECAVMYALGADVTPGKIAALWAAAWAARQPTDADARIADLFKPNLPDCGVPAQATFKAWREDANDGPYYWPRVAIPVDNIAHTDPSAAIPAMFYPPKPKYHWNASNCGVVFEDVAWVSLLRPGWQEPFFRQAILSLETDQKLSDHYCLAFLEPLLRPGATVGPMGHTMLVYYLASSDKSVTSLTSDVVAELALSKKLDVDVFAAALKQLLSIDALPTGRWTKGLAAIAQAGASDFGRDVITQAVDFAPDDTPRDIGGMLELLYELHISSNTTPTRPETLASLKAMSGGGKASKFAGKLLKLAKQHQGQSRQSV